MISSILAATDFSPEANEAVQQAAAIAERCEARVLLLHATARAPQLPEAASVWKENAAAVAKMQELRRAQALEDLGELEAELKNRGLTVESMVGEGAPAALIHEVSMDRDVDLVVTGARGVGEANLFIIGSVAEGVVRRAHRKVLIGRGAAKAFSKILVTTDLTEASLAVIQSALALAAPDAAVDLLHVVEWGDHAPQVRGPHGSPAIDFKKLWGVAREEAEKELARLLERHPGSARLNASVKEGVAATTILEHAKEHGCDLIVVGRTSSPGPLHERVSERVIRHAECSVLIAPAGA